MSFLEGINKELKELNDRRKEREELKKVPAECKLCHSYDWDDKRCKLKKCKLPKKCINCPYRIKEVLFCNVCYKDILDK